MNEISGYCGLFYIITSTEDFLGSKEIGAKININRERTTERMLQKFKGQKA